MPKKPEKKGEEVSKHKISSGNLSIRIPTSSIQRRIQQEKERMLSVLHFDENLRGQVEDMFNINFEGLPAGKEPMFFSTAVFRIENAELAMRKIGKLPDMDIAEENGYVWTRPYPKGHWNPMSNMPGARQIIGDIQINSDNTLRLETKTKSWMTGLIYCVMRVLGREIKLISLEFQNPLDILSK